MSNANLTSDELKPCPHCGNGSLLVIARRASIYPLPDVKVFEGRVLCEECGGAMILRHMTRSDAPDGIGVSEMRKILSVRWNSRAAVTDEQFTLAVHDGRAWEPVRECRVEYPEDARMCSECHYYIGPNNVYCGHCGAKVTNEEEVG